MRLLLLFLALPLLAMGADSPVSVMAYKCTEFSCVLSIDIPSEYVEYMNTDLLLSEVNYLTAAVNNLTALQKAEEADAKNFLDTVESNRTDVQGIASKLTVNITSLEGQVNGTQTQLNNLKDKASYLFSAFDCWKLQTQGGTCTISYTTPLPTTAGPTEAPTSTAAPGGETTTPGGEVTVPTTEAFTGTTTLFTGTTPELPSTQSPGPTTTTEPFTGSTPSTTTAAETSPVTKGTELTTEAASIQSDATHSTITADATTAGITETPVTGTTETTTDSETTTTTTCLPTTSIDGEGSTTSPGC